MSYVENATEIEQKSYPKQFNLILRDKRDDPNGTEDGEQIGKIMGATGNHCRSGSRAGHAQYLALTMHPLNEIPQVAVQADLNAEADSKTYHKIPELRKLILGKIPSRYQSKNGKVNTEQEAAC